MKKYDSDLDGYSIALFIIVGCLLVFAPLARGSVLLWAGTIIQILTLTALGILILKALKTDRPVFMKTVLSRAIAGLVVLTIVSMVFSSHKPFAVEGFFMFLTYIVIYYAVIAVSQDRRLERALVYVIIGTAFLVSLIGIIKRVDMNPFFWWIYPEMGTYKSDFLTGVYVNQNHLAGFLEMAIPMVMALFITRYRGLEQKFILTSIVLVLMITQAFTLSWGGWISTLGALIFLFIILVTGRQFYQKRLVVFIAACSIAIGVTILSVTPVVRTVSTVIQAYPEENLSARMRTWKGTVNSIRDNLYTGTGPNTFAISYPAYQVPGLPILNRSAHNDYLQFISEIGILCVPLILLVIFNFYRSGFKMLNASSRQKRGFALGGMVGVFAIIIHSFYDFNLFIPANAVLFTVIAAIASGRESK